MKQGVAVLSGVPHWSLLRFTHGRKMQAASDRLNTHSGLSRHASAFSPAHSDWAATSCEARHKATRTAEAAAATESIETRHDTTNRRIKTREVATQKDRRVLCNSQHDHAWFARVGRCFEDCTRRFAESTQHTHTRRHTRRGHSWRTRATRRYDSIRQLLRHEPRRAQARNKQRWRLGVRFRICPIALTGWKTRLAPPRDATSRTR